MNSRKKWQVVFLAALIGLAIWNVARHGKENAPDATREAGAKPAETSKTPSVSEDPGVENKVPGRNAAKVNPALDDVKSPIARRYLAHLMAKDGRFVNDRNGLWSVNNAFEQAWMLTSRMDLTEEKQDRLAEFLLEVDSFTWMLWEKIDPERTNGWVKSNLTEEQQTTFRNLLAEQKDGFAGMTELMGTIARKTGEPNDEKTKQLSAKEQKELRQSMVTQAHVYQNYNLLADRIPLTAEQQEKVLDALRSGEKAPVLPQDYEMLDLEHAEAAVRSDTAWLGKLIPEARYETYVEHFLAQIEIRRFHQERP